MTVSRAVCRGRAAAAGVSSFGRQHFLYFSPLPHGQGLLRPMSVMCECCGDRARKDRVVAAVLDDDGWNRSTDHRGQGCVALEDLSCALSANLEVLDELVAAEHAAQLGELAVV
jgi:hypothetical protein